jgi:hypothetical protein
MLVVAVRAEGAQVLGIVTPAQLSRDDVIDLGGERPARAAEAITLEHLEPQHSPRSRRSLATRVLRAGLSVGTSRDRAVWEAPITREELAAAFADRRRMLGDDEP